MHILSKKNMKSLLRLSLLLLGGIVIGFVLLVAVYAIPIAPIAQNVRLSVQSLDGSWQTGEIPYEQLVKGYLSTQLDNTTDATMLMAAANESDLPLIQRAINVSTYTYQGMYSALIEYGKNGTVNLYSSPSARYWLGFLVFLKPLLCFLSYMDIRMLQMIVQLLLLCAVIVGFCRRGLTRFVLAFGLSLLAVTPAITGFSMQFSTVYTLFLLAMLALLYCPCIMEGRFHMVAFFLLTGMATSYFDYLTYPIAVFGMPFILFQLLRPTGTRKEALTRLLLCLAAWFAGYFGMWAGKWIITMLLGSDAWFLPNLLAKITERSFYEASGTSISLISVLSSVLGVFAKKTYLLVAVLALSVYFALLFRRMVHCKKDLPLAVQPVCFPSTRKPDGQALAISLTALLPFLWYIFASNHTYNHSFFTSRALVVSAFAAFSLLQLLLERVNGMRVSVKPDR